MSRAWAPNARRTANSRERKATVRATRLKSPPVASTNASIAKSVNVHTAKRQGAIARPTIASSVVRPPITASRSSARACACTAAATASEFPVVLTITWRAMLLDSAWSEGS